jgi:NAD-dependent dihydropyrimidine dehydrogenase PreA subunit
MAPSLDETPVGKNQSMTYVITAACIDVKDQSCVAVCPVDCIYVEADDRMCYIHPDECINCAVCVEACPVAAIYEQHELSDENAPFLQVNADWFADKDQARASVDQIKARD